MKKAIFVFVSMSLGFFILSGCVSTNKNMQAQKNGKIYFISQAECVKQSKLDNNNILICKDKNGLITYHKPMSKEAMQLQMHKEKIRAIRDSRNRDYYNFCGYRRFCY